MRINEAYEQDAHSTGVCRRQEEQCVDVAVPLILTPSAGLGTVTTVCRGEPTAVCVTDPEGASCTITFTQKLCISVPVQYGVRISEGASRIACGAEEAGKTDRCVCGCRCEKD